METFFSFMGFGVSAICFGVGAGIVGYGAVEAIRLVFRKLAV